MSTESQSQTGLATLNEAYTDSEGEAESDQEQNIDYRVPPSKDNTPSSNGSNNYFFYKKETKVNSNLVSYGTHEEEDERMDSDDSRSSDVELDSNSTSDQRTVPIGPMLSPISFHRTLLNKKKDEIQLPPEPPGRVDEALQAKISELLKKSKEGKNMNASLQQRKDFRNPSIYEKLITYCEIREQGTNYPPETFDPFCWGPESHYIELAKRQKEEMDKREREKKERTKVEFISGTVKKPSDSSSDAARRKSKWDVGISQLPASALKPATLITPSVLPVPTGTKPTVISAFGTITKKAKQ